MKPRIFALRLFFPAVLLVLAPNLCAAQTYMGTANVLMVIVDFADDTGTFDAAAFETDWLAPLCNFYSTMSEGQFALNVTYFDEVIRLDNREFYHKCFLGAACRDLWSSADNPLETLVDEGHIQATADGLVPAGGGAGDVFDCVLFLTAQGVNYWFPGWSIENRRTTADPTSHRYPMGYADLDLNSDGDFDAGEYGNASHELGHMLSDVYTHPAGYISAYELMDSCYPCALGIFTRVDHTALTGSFHNWFSGWLPASALVKFTPPTGGTEVLAPIEIASQQTPAPQGIQVLTGAGYSYILECRRFIPPDELIDTWPDRPAAREGVLILKATPGADPETWLMLAPAYPEEDRWESSYVAGQTFTDAARDLTISVGAAVGDGFPVTVTYGPGATAPIPDVAMIPWLTPPMNDYETVDIWVDSPCNGYERDAPWDETRLRYGRRDDPEQTVIGNGDDPCANEVNLVYARVRNYGTQAATNVVVHFEVTNPLGVGIRDDTGWTRFATVTQADFPGLASIAPDGFVDVSAEWRPEVAFTPGTERVAWHSCLRVVVDTVSGELVTSNQDGDREQENVAWFEMPRPTIATPYEPINESIFLANSANVPREFYLSVDSALPDGWNLDIAGGETRFLLDAGEARDIPVQLTAPPETPVGKSYFVKVRAYSVEEGGAPDSSIQRYDSIEVAGVLLAAQTVLETTLSISATLEGSTLNVTGTMTPPVPGATVAIRYEPPSGPSLLQLVAVDNAGKFSHQYAQAYAGRWGIRAIWQGDTEHASALSNKLIVNIVGPGGCFGGATMALDCPSPRNVGEILPFVLVLFAFGLLARRAKRAT
ncbi:MAG TPA: hypothetical protein VMZ06_10080 [Candidatus Bathyarchaeia archaeon]|nr:hypothetical protein [Candidatus Bathyarchaeia archaeon]